MLPLTRTAKAATQIRACIHTHIHAYVTESKSGECPVDIHEAQNTHTHTHTHTPRPLDEEWIGVRASAFHGSCQQPVLRLVKKKKPRKGQQKEPKLTTHIQYILRPGSNSA